MDRLDRGETNMQRAIDRRASTRENADHRKRLVRMFGKAAVARPVVKHYAVAKAITETLGGGGAEHDVE